MISIIERVALHAKQQPDQKAFVFVSEHDEPGESITWAELWLSAQQLAGKFNIKTEPENTGVLIYCVNEKFFIIALLAIWMRGAVAIPTAAGRQKGAIERSTHIMEAGCPEIVLHDSVGEALDLLRESVPDAELIPVVGDNCSEDTQVIESFLNTGALLQFTSGSTAKPKPVYLTSDNISANCLAIEEAYSLSSKTVAVHWLPLFHDMGLVGSCIAVMWSGSLSVLLRPTIFIQRPRAWLEHISSWGGTITSAPNFAYERLCEMFQDGNKEGLDLSSLVNVVIGGEPVSKETLDKLLLTLKDCGLSPESLAPSYGMAEATLLISSGKRKGGPVYSSSHSDFPVTGLGSAVKGLNVVLRDQETLETKSPGELGEIWISGDCVGQVIPLESDWRHREGDREIRTGDFGYFENDSLFITGRNVNKIIVRGRNVFAEDVEFLTRQSQLSGFCAGVAAFGIDEGGSQNLCILIEDNRSRRLFDIKALNEIVQSKLGVKPYQIVLLKRATLPRTSSGKIKRGLAKEQFLSHKYEDRVI